MGKYNFVLIGAVALLLVSCKNYDTIGESNSGRASDKVNLEQQEDDEILKREGILFLHFNVYGSNSGEVLMLSKAEITEGSFIKSDYDLSAAALPGHLFCTFLNNKDEIIKTTLINNPLIQRVEYSEDGETIKSKVINKDSAYFFLRTNYLGDIYSVKVEMIDSLGIGKELEHFNLETFLEGEKK